MLVNVLNLGGVFTVQMQVIYQGFDLLVFASNAVGDFCCQSGNPGG